MTPFLFESAPALVLVVDDNPTNRYVVSTTLRRAGHSVVEAEDGTQALALLSTAEQLPEVAVVDVRLPDMTGFDVCERIKSAPATASLPVIHISASAITVTDRTQGLNRGADAYLTEPIAPDEMLATVTATLRYARARRRAETLARRLHRLNQATLALYSAEDPRTLAQAAADSAADLLDAPAAVALTVQQGHVHVAAAPRPSALPDMGPHQPAPGYGSTPPGPPPGSTLTGRPFLSGGRFGDAPGSGTGTGIPLGTGTGVRTVRTAEWATAPAVLSPYPTLTMVSARAKPARPPVHLAVPADAVGGPDDEELLAQLAHACTLALEALRAYSEEHALALTLQRGFLPESLPETSRAELAVRYLPASQHTEIGGDFYEALETPAGLVVAVGDVAGHSLDAAMVMGQVRHALRAYATEGHPPDAVLDRLDRLLCTVQPGTMVTLCILLLEAGSDTVQVANAGHLPPLLRTPDGASRYLREHGPLLGMGLPHPPPTRVEVPPDSDLLLVTDGLIERRNQDMEDSLRHLAVAHGEAPRNPEDLCAYLLHRFPPDGNDDIALMSVRVNACTPPRADG
ncbi:SpoIIE family protein phosphatase [Streptomyces sp. NPDC091272]|uniref:SpoIIE family protein phosphatase n=1 Tax=Streptomyces sp. NPDC091272 TaxID=3365981 RepID=UPI0038015D7C